MNRKQLVPEKQPSITMTFDELEIFLADKDWWIIDCHTEYPENDIIIESQYIDINKV